MAHSVNADEDLGSELGLALKNASSLTEDGLLTDSGAALASPPKRAVTPLPWMRVIIIAIVVVADGLNSSMITPFLGYMVRVVDLPC
jgi:hypothetical protein